MPTNQAIKDKNHNRKIGKRIRTKNLHKKKTRELIGKQSGQPHCRPEQC